MRFSYKARTREGKTISGMIEAPSKNALVEILGKQGARLLLAHEESADSKKSGKKKGFFHPKVKSRDLVVFTRQLSTMVSAGVPLPRSLVTLADQAENKYFKSVIGSIGKDIEAGISLGEAFGKHPDVFS